MMLDELYVAKGIDPVADALAGTKYSDVFDLSLFNKLVFLIHKGVGATGVSTITARAYSSTDPSTADTAIPFRYKAVTSGDTQGAVTQADTTGFALTAGSSQVYAIEIDSQAAASAGLKYVYLKAVESVDSPVLAGITVLGWPKHAPIGESAID